MLDKLREQAFQTLAATPNCTLSTVGPVGLQASNIPLGVDGDQLYVLVPNTSDHLFNLETEPTIVLTAVSWQLTGQVSQIDAKKTPFTEQQIAWSVVYQVTPLRMHLAPDNEDHISRTIDF